MANRINVVKLCKKKIIEKEKSKDRDREGKANTDY